MKFVRALSRIAALSLAAAGLAGLTWIYGDSARPPLPGPRWQAERGHRPSAPKVGRVSEFIGELLELGVFAVGGRIVLRLRLSPVSRSEGQPILLGLPRGRYSAIDPA